MPARLVLITGGCRSGKSAFALKRAGEHAAGGVFVATCPVLDAEMADRVRRHREERRGRGWDTLEEETAIARAIASCPGGAVVVVDCLTLWVNNIMFQREKEGGAAPSEDELAVLAKEFAAACLARDGLVVAVANEVGLGIVPDNAMARRFRDLAGRVNQTVAALADEVYFMVSGLPMRIK